MMQWPDMSNALVWLWIAIWTLLTWLFFLLSLWIIDGKLHMKRKIWACLIAAFLSVLIIPLVQGVTGLASPFLNGLAPYIAYLLVIVFLLWLVTDQWKSAVIVGFVGILFILIVYNILQEVGVTGSTLWPLFV